MKFHGNAPRMPLYMYTYKKTTAHPKNIYAVINNMEYRKRSKDQMGGRSKPDQVLCRKHPKHRQSPGVCSICLRERLSHLSTSSRYASTTMASSSSSSSLSSYSSHYSSSKASSCSSPMQRYRFASDAKGSFSFLSSGKNALTKSRSVAFVTRMRAGEDGHRNKKSGFWSKLLRPRGKRTEEVLVYSRTMRERVGVGASRIQ